MFSLKSELFKKQQELTSRKSAANVGAVHAIRKQHKIKSAETSAPKVPDHEKNPGIEERNARDLMQTEEEMDKSKMVKSVLEAKAKLYDKMTSGDILPDEESSSMFLVDFEQKSIDARMKRDTKNLNEKPKVGVNLASELSREIEKSSNPDEEWVEYTDGLGRTRTCLKKDLPRMQRIDRKLGIEKKEEKPKAKNETKTLLSDDMRREMEREKWEEEAMEELNGPIHYETLRGGEIRELGVGYYAFSTDQETREAQMKMLHKMREETKKEKENLKETQRKKRTALQARLEKVRASRIKKLKAQGKEVPAELLKPIELPPIEDNKTPTAETDSNNDVTIAEVTKRDDSNRPMREWDKGKEWTPAEPPKAPKSWVNPRDERPDEFAPPSFYYGNKMSKQKANSSTETDLTEDTDLSQSNDAPPSAEKGETPSDLISRIRHEISQTTNIHRIKASKDGAVSEENSVIHKCPENSSEEKSAVPTDTPEFSQKNAEPPTENPDPGLYVPSSDNKPVTIKVKTLPKKNTVLQTKSAFSED